MDISITYIWLFAGVLFLAAEALGVSGIGLLFAGLGALTVGSLLNLDIAFIQPTLTQFIVFLAASALWAVILWKPMKKFRVNKNAPGYHNMIGETAYVGSAGLHKHHGGEVTWSGTIMKAHLAPDANVETLAAGSLVTIADIKGATLIVRPKI